MLEYIADWSVICHVNMYRKACVPIISVALIHVQILHHFYSQTVLFLPPTLPSLSPCSEALDSLKSVIDKSKGLKVTAVRPLVLAAEENLHNMVVDLDKVVTKVRTLFCTLCTSKGKKDNSTFWEIHFSSFLAEIAEHKSQSDTTLMSVQ